ncbi:excalibur calcium-binding domain-containing protein [Palleronia sediminis]|uniref:Excalibur calcium-binding domain-containing protein n=1 Tax=Palleronia sediminis TaxID=2547833 RepID=A0A4R6AB43_9RHOB|nr:excalibur calcium-binding domain-containing protein [Palleronia sediminis]TDL79538.1 excalibur calcium-binding domain-containing protein [Palleronia sediminis]
MVGRACLRILALAMLTAGAAVAGPLELSDTPFAPYLTAQTFTCSNKTCGEMRSCAEACHALLVCGETARDRDRDGIPCESLCSAPC